MDKTHERLIVQNQLGLAKTHIDRMHAAGDVPREVGAALRNLHDAIEALSKIVVDSGSSVDTPRFGRPNL